MSQAVRPEMSVGRKGRGGRDKTGGGTKPETRRSWKWSRYFNFSVTVFGWQNQRQRQKQSRQTTGSFRKNGKSKTVFMSTKFHKKLIFSAFFSRELATNLRSWASRTAKITLWYPEKLAPPVCFQALVGCLKPTTDPETLSKDHKGVIWSVRGKIGSTK